MGFREETSFDKTPTDIITTNTDGAHLLILWLCYNKIMGSLRRYNNQIIPNGSRN